MKFYVTVGIILALALHTLAEETKDSTAAATPAATTAASKVGAASDNSYKFSMIPTGYGAVLAAGGAVVIGVVVLLAIAAIVSPLFGYRLCQVFSTCDVPLSSTGYSTDGYSGYAASSPYPSTYQKRSIGYAVGPILHALNSAYEKYGNGESPLALNFKKINSE